ncbi:kinesin-like protein K39 [Paralichthys olivaceus]|uniref:kinesin-like protein K39 n=1 Tax=Paralichthys olivaceus TaxID=8255 RepID=UPI003753807C
MATVVCEPMQLQKIREDLIKAIAESKAIKLDALAKLAAEHQKVKNTEARCTTLEAYLHHETAKADRCWSRAEALEEANIALKEEVELFKRERSQLQTDLKCKDEHKDSVRWSQLQEELKRKDELIINAVETRKDETKALKLALAELAAEHQKLQNTEARCATLEAYMHHETAKAEALEKANIALKEKVELFKSEKSQLQTDLKRKDELIIYAVETRKARKRSQVDLMAKLASKEDELKSTEARCAALEAKLYHETAKADRCWSRAEAMEEANIALKEEVELFKSERSQPQTQLKCKDKHEDSVRWSQLQDELKRKDELIIYAVETRKAHKRSQIDLMAKLASKEDELKSTEARCAALDAYLYHETAKADRCWSRAEALEEANIALKEEVELFKSERSQPQTQLKCKDEHEDSVRCSQLQEELMAKLASKEDELKSTEARCAALEANLHQELTQAQETWIRNLEALEKENVALKEKVHLLKSAQSQLELVITKIEERQAHCNHNNQSDSMTEMTSNKELQSTEDECEVTPETPEASQELAQSEEECGSEVELPQATEECSSEVELPQSEGGCSSEGKLLQVEGECSTQVELPQIDEERSNSEMQQLVILKNVKVEHETEESKHKSSNKKAKNNKQLHQKKKKKRRSQRPHSFY